MQTKPRLTPAQRRYLEMLRDGTETPHHGHGQARVSWQLHKLGLAEHQPHPTKPYLAYTVISEAGRAWFQDATDNEDR